MNPFCLLKDPQAYRSEDWDLLQDAADREYWLSHFQQGFTEAMQMAARQYGAKAAKRIAAATEKFSGILQKLRQDPASLPGGKLSVLELDRLRERILAEHALHDPYADVKRRANESAMELYAQIVRRLHIMPDGAKWLHLIRGVFAGNLYDLGSASQMELSRDPEDFLAAEEQTKPRPWLIDHLDLLAEDLRSVTPPKWGKAIVFVDNAGPDFILGLMPLMRELSLYGLKVVLAANEAPALNDMTVDETIDVVQRLAGTDEDLAALIQAGMFEVVSTGGRIPLLDLSDVSEDLNDAAKDADLVILEGMGRAVETNFNASFKTDSLHLALLKNPRIAARIGGQMYDCICKYTRA